MPAAIIKLGYTCNNNCIFCHAKPKNGDLTTQQVLKKVGRLGNKTTMIYFSGGEPTIRKDLLTIARYTRNKGFKIGLITNARMLSNGKYIRQFLDIGLEKVFTTFLSSEELIHNAITRTDSFTQTVTAIRNILDNDVSLTINTVIVKDNLQYLDKTTASLRQLGVKDIRLSLVEPIIDMSYAPEIEKSAEEVKKVLGKYPETGWDGFPLCMMKGYEKRAKDLHTYGIRLISEVRENDFFLVDQGNKIKVKECKDCKRNDVCGGIYYRYLEKYKPRLKPVK